ncbi:AraC family transcriptional regulator [Paenibacillus sp. HWE-109]|uniref:helix-turn-helix transcriptional regulator n=1 Tax=Paenibacillus sp. HWE-109 TaxID=1306526 RepID=UPI001EDCEC96|nr:AraC family transcriptional regulator [Paenibacillus sp. HWE-109]UKS28118.1 AraC family transcriptional regulator [Paenibacillus sp. HWE-109]
MKKLQKEWGNPNQMETIFLDKPRFLSAVQVRSEHLAEYSFSSNPHTEIFLLQEGRGELYNGGQMQSILEGDLLVIHPDTEYGMRPTTGTSFRGILISISGVFISGLPEGRLLDQDALPLLRMETEFDNFNRFFSDIYKEACTPAIGSSEIIASLLQTFLIMLFRFTDHRPRSTSISIPQIVKAYIEENYVRDLSLNDLASVVYVSPYHLAHLFKVEIGISPIQYLIKCRIDKAKRLLTGTTLSVQDISLQVGYPNSNYFNLLFKKTTGESPGKFRKQS